MYRTKTCGELRIENLNESVVLAGWVQKARKMGGMIFVDLRDRYGITQLVFNQEINTKLCDMAAKIGREWVIQILHSFAMSKKPLSNFGSRQNQVLPKRVLGSDQERSFWIGERNEGNALKNQCNQVWQFRFRPFFHKILMRIFRTHPQSCLL